MTLIRMRKLVDLETDWPNIYQAPHKNQATVNVSQPRPVELDGMLRSVWSWIKSRYREEMVLPPTIGNLWLLPIKGNHVRRCMPGRECQRMMIISTDDSLFKVLGLDALPTHERTVSAQILDCESLSPQAVNLIRQQALETSSLNTATTDNLETLLDWLTANADLILRVGDTEKEQLLQHLERLVRGRNLHRAGPNNPTRARVAGLLKQLRLFTKIYAEAPYE